MPRTFNIAVFEGDGIGPEVMGPTLTLLKQLAEQLAEQPDQRLTTGSEAYTLNFNTFPAGANYYRETGQSLPAASLEGAQQADAILLSAMGLPDVRYPDGTEISPQIELRKAFTLYAGVRPVTVYPGQYCPLDIPTGQSIDFVLIRESTEGLFWSQGQGQVSDDEARETLVITRKTSEKLFRFAFKLAEQRRASGRGQSRVTCVDKANVFRAFAFFRKIFDETAAQHTDLTADHAYVDATALWMVQQPWSMDVLVTENMFGDILSDLGAGLMGGLGMAPSGDIGDQQAVFQPCHGSAPDIMGQGTANPAAMILSAAMMLDWLGHKHDVPAALNDGERLRKAVHQVVSQRIALTRDLGGTASTRDFALAVGSELT